MKKLNQASKGYAWTLTELILKSGTEFAVQIILARILMPEDFGILGLITVFIALASTITNSGFSQALIREKKLTDKDYSTVFLYSMFMSAVLYLILLGSSKFIAQFFNDYRLVNVFRITGFIFFSNALLIIPLAKFSRLMNFKVQAITNSVASLFSGVLAIILAVQGFGYWALVIKLLLSSLIYSVTLFILTKWVPKFVFDVVSFKKFFSFGWKLLLTGLLAQIYQNLYYLIIGRSFTSAELGYYTNAKKLKDLPAQALSMTISKVAYPMLSKSKENEQLLQNKFKIVLIGSAFVIFPLLLTLSGMADTVILVLFGEKWIPAIPYLQVLCFAGLTYSLGSINLTILNVYGRSDLFLLVDAINMVCGLIVISIVITLGLGIKGLLWSAVFNSIIAYFFNAHFSSKVTSYTLMRQLKDLFPIVIVSILTFFMLILINQYIYLSIYVKFFLYPLVSFIFYSLFALLFMKKQLKLFKQMLYTND